MADQEEVIRKQMEETRTSLSEKLETLEQQVVQTVQGATCAVSETVESVKEAVQETVDSVKGSVQDTVATVKSTFDLQQHVQDHPWMMMGGATVAGFAAGWLLGGTRTSRAAAAPPPSRGDYREERAEERRQERIAAFAQAPSARSTPSWAQQLNNLFGDEIAKVKGLALGTLFGLIRDVVTPMVPEQLEPQVKDIINNVTVKLGGEPVREPLIHGHNGRHSCDR